MRRKAALRGLPIRRSPENQSAHIERATAGSGLGDLEGAALWLIDLQRGFGDLSTVEGRKNRGHRSRDEEVPADSGDAGRLSNPFRAAWHAANQSIRFGLDHRTYRPARDLCHRSSASRRAHSVQNPRKISPFAAHRRPWSGKAPLGHNARFREGDGIRHDAFRDGIDAEDTEARRDRRGGFAASLPAQVRLAMGRRGVLSPGGSREVAVGLLCIGDVCRHRPSSLETAEVAFHRRKARNPPARPGYANCRGLNARRGRQRDRVPTFRCAGMGTPVPRYGDATASTGGTNFDTFLGSARTARCAAASTPRSPPSIRPAADRPRGAGRGADAVEPDQ